MRVVTGKYKNRKLFLPPKKYRIRPTTAVVKKALIDIFREIIPGAKLLDLFSGTGGAGIEFLSNGAKFVTFIEASPHNAQLIKRNLDKLQISEEYYRIINKDFKNALLFLSKIGEKFDFIFIDPPYFTNYIKESLLILSELNLYIEDVIIISEQHNREKIEEKLGKFKIYDIRKYGTSVVRFWRIEI